MNETDQHEFETFRREFAELRKELSDIREDVQKNREFRLATDAMLPRLANTADDIYRSLVGTLKDQGLIGKHDALVVIVKDFKKYVDEDLEPKVKALWNDRVKTLAIGAVAMTLVGLILHIAPHILSWLKKII